MTPRFGNKQPTKAQHRASLQTALMFREREITDREAESMARSHRMSVEDVRAIWAEIVGRRAA